MPMKRVVMLATIHQHQVRGNPGNAEFEKRVGYLKSKLGGKIILEEWSEKQGKSAAEEFAPSLGLQWFDVGTPDETQFWTYAGPINFPGHDGTLSDWDAPGMSGYGPFINQEARERQMAKNIQAQMQSSDGGIFILGLAHLYSMYGKLRDLGFDVIGLSWF